MRISSYDVQNRFPCGRAAPSLLVLPPIKRETAKEQWTRGVFVFAKPLPAQGFRGIREVDGW